MFVLSIIEDKIKIVPELFNEDPIEVLTRLIEDKYLNKVIPEVGLVVAFYDFVEIGDPYVYPSEGSAHRRVTFRLAVFRPFVGEIIVGRIISCTEKGVRVSLEFFDDIIIQPQYLQAPSEYNAKKQCWIWRYEPEAGDDLNIRVGDRVRFRVRTINFTAVTTTAKGTVATTTTESTEASRSEDIPPMVRRRSTSMDLTDKDDVPSVMQVVGGMNEDGLGMVDWW